MILIFPNQEHGTSLYLVKFDVFNYIKKNVRSYSQIAYFSLVQIYILSALIFSLCGLPHTYLSGNYQHMLL